MPPVTLSIAQCLVARIERNTMYLPIKILSEKQKGIEIVKEGFLDCGATSALKSGPVSVLLPFLEGPQTGPVPESFRMQEPQTGTAKNRKKTVKTGCNWSRNEYIKTRAISVIIGHIL